MDIMIRREIGICRNISSSEDADDITGFSKSSIAGSIGDGSSV